MTPPALRNLPVELANSAKKTPKGEWVLGGDWDETKWTPAAMPTKEMIDPLTPDTPVFVSRYDGHMALANSVTLRLAGITAQTPDPPGGVIVRDAQGNPTGALKDAAMDYVYKVIPPLSHEQRSRAVKRALAHAASLGVTSVQHMNPEYADIAVYSELLERGELTARIYAAPLITGVDDQVKIGIRHAFGGPYLRIGALKAYADGSLGSAHRIFLRALQQSAEQPRPALRRNASGFADAGSHDESRRRRHCRSAPTPSAIRAFRSSSICTPKW